MNLKIVQVIAGLVAAIAFILAFMAAGVFLVSVLFMAIGLAAIGWLAWSMIRKARDTPRDRAA
ncbi:MAG: hypothetical protein KKC14_04935 [Alphaproteobacteria bacterium]|nr:hypothetical protein [Alphaproteobacteria bacterium]